MRQLQQQNTITMQLRIGPSNIIEFYRMKMLPTSETSHARMKIHLVTFMSCIKSTSQERLNLLTPTIIVSYSRLVNGLMSSYNLSWRNNVPTSKALLNKSRLETRTAPPNASLFTYDAVSMYTNIDTDACIEVLTEYLVEHEHHFKYNTGALVGAIIIVMRNNIYSFTKAA